MWTVGFRTLGCKLNQAETAILAGMFAQKGYGLASAEDPVDVVVIHTCTVTARTDAKCRQAIHHVLRRNPSCTVIVAGCYAQVCAEEIAQISGVDYIVGTEDKFRLFDFFPGPGKLSRPLIRVSPIGGNVAFSSPVFPLEIHTRAFLKIQSGCNRHCAYCIVPMARGPGQSEPMAYVLKNAELFVHKGFKEIVITGTHIGDYGKDIAGTPLLAQLLRELLKIKGIVRIRLSSLDPDEVTEKLLDVIAEEERICRHFHISLQSGSDTILQAMKRAYTTRDVEMLIEKLVAKFGIFGLGADLITGFPGETEALFQETFRFVERFPFTYFHVFPFSLRRGTLAEKLRDGVPSSIRLERAQILRKLGIQKRKAFASQFIGKTVSVLFEAKEKDHWMYGLTPEYLRVEVPYHEFFKNQILQVKVETEAKNGVRGRVIHFNGEGEKS